MIWIHLNAEKFTFKKQLREAGVASSLHDAALTYSCGWSPASNTDLQPFPSADVSPDALNVLASCAVVGRIFMFFIFRQYLLFKMLFIGLILTC